MHTGAVTQTDSDLEQTNNHSIDLVVLLNLSIAEMFFQSNFKWVNAHSLWI